MEEQVPFKFIDLFAGVGGFHEALSRLGGEAVFASEWVPELQALYTRNFALEPVGDINQVNISEIPDHDLLAAGFPCQPFSKAGEQLGFEHTEQGALFFKVAEILKAKQPRWFILENVPNILRHRQGKTLELIKKLVIEELGYDLRVERFSPHHFGIPQVRDRVYFIGSKAPLDTFAWPERSTTPTDIRSVLDEFPEGARPLSADTQRCLEVWQEFLDASPADLELPSFPIWSMEFGATYPYEDETPHALLKELGPTGLNGYKGSFGVVLDDQATADETRALLPSHGRRSDFVFPKWKRDFIRQNRQFYADNKTWIDPWLPKIKRFPSSMQKLEWNTKGEEKNLWNFVIQFRASGVRLKRSRTAPSLIAMTDTQVPIIGWEKRYMTPRECSRLQSLGHIELPAKRTAAYKALGNAVNADVVNSIAGRLIAATDMAARPNSFQRPAA